MCIVYIALYSIFYIFVRFLHKYMHTAYTYLPLQTTSPFDVTSFTFITLTRFKGLWTYGWYDIAPLQTWLQGIAPYRLPNISQSLGWSGQKMEQHDAGTGGWTFGCVGLGVRGRCFLGWGGDLFNFSLEMCLGLESWVGLGWIGLGGHGWLHFYETSARKHIFPSPEISGWCAGFGRVAILSFGFACEWFCLTGWQK